MATIDAPSLKGQRPVQAGSGIGFARLAAVTIVLALAAALTGLLVEGVYTGAGSTATMLRGYDLVTAAVVLPALSVAAYYSQQGSLMGRLVTTGLLADLVYIYAFYVFGTGFNDLFLLDLAVFATSLTWLVLTLTGLDIDSVAARFSVGGPLWPVSAALGILGVSLGTMWIWGGVVNAVSGTVPVGSALVETPRIVHLSLALDLGVQVPVYLAAALLVRRRSGWGHVLAFIALLSGIPEQIGYVVALPFQVASGVAGAVRFDPVEVGIVALYVVGFTALLRGVRRRQPQPGRT